MSTSPLFPMPEMDVPKIDPDEEGDYLHWVFRETFLLFLQDPDHSSAFRAFAQAIVEMAMEGHHGWRGNPSDLTAYQLRAATADLRFLQHYLRRDVVVDFDGEDDRVSAYFTSREARWRRFAARLEGKLGQIADEIETELEEGLQEEDEPRPRSW